MKFFSNLQLYKLSKGTNYNKRTALICKTTFKSLANTGYMRKEARNLHFAISITLFHSQNIFTLVTIKGMHSNVN